MAVFTATEETRFGVRWHVWMLPRVRPTVGNRVSVSGESAEKKGETTSYLKNSGIYEKKLRGNKKFTHYN